MVRSVKCKYTRVYFSFEAFCIPTRIRIYKKRITNSVRIMYNIRGKITNEYRSQVILNCRIELSLFLICLVYSFKQTKLVLGEM